MSIFEHLRFVKSVSKCLRGNPLGSSLTREYAVLLPDSYDEQMSYPSLWFLDGYLGNGFSMLKIPGALGLSLCEALLTYQRQQLIRPFVAIFPDCSTPLGGSQYLNSAACGSFLDHLTEELVASVEANFSVSKNPSYRVLLGHSSGGYGALVIPALKPGVFGASVASAADSCFEYSQLPLFPVVSQTLLKTGGIDEFLKKVFLAEMPDRLSKSDFVTLMTVAMASCYSPCIGANAAHCELPFDLETLELKGECWDLWLKHDPLSLIPNNIKNFQTLGYLHLDCGNEDEYAAQYGHRRLSRFLRQNGFVHEFTEFKGTHQGTQYRYKTRLQKLEEWFAKNYP